MVCKTMFLNTLNVGETVVRNRVHNTNNVTEIIAPRKKLERGGRNLSQEICFGVALHSGTDNKKILKLQS